TGNSALHRLGTTDLFYLNGYHEYSGFALPEARSSRLHRVLFLQLHVPVDHHVDRFSRLQLVRRINQEAFSVGRHVKRIPCRSSRVSRARYTSPIPPAPRGDRIS